MKIDIDKLTEAELIDLNHRIVERLRFLQQVHAHQSMLEFSIGDKVSFEPQGRPPSLVSLPAITKKRYRCCLTKAGAGMFRRSCSAK